MNEEPVELRVSVRNAQLLKNGDMAQNYLAIVDGPEGIGLKGLIFKLEKLFSKSGVFEETSKNENEFDVTIGMYNYGEPTYLQELKVPGGTIATAKSLLAMVSFCLKPQLEEPISEG